MIISMGKALYVLYDEDELPLIVDNMSKIADYLNRPVRSVRSGYYHQKRGLINKMNKGYTIERVE